MTAQLAPALIFQGITATGAPLVAGKLFSYAAGTNTPQATYVDSTQTTPNSNPTILNAYGQVPLWLDPTKAYKFALQDSAGNPLYTVDNVLGALSQPNVVVGPPASGTALTVIGIPNTFSAQFNLGPIGITNNGAPLVALNSTGAGYSLIQNDSPLNWSIAYTSSASPFSLGTPLLKWNSSGNLTIPAPSGGVALNINGEPAGGTALIVSGVGVSTNPVVALVNQNIAGQSSGLAIFAGTNATDLPFAITNAVGTTTTLSVNGLGAMQVGGITPQVAGSINALAGYYINNIKQPTFAAPLTGFANPTGNVVVPNFNGATATLVQCSNTIAQILLTLKAAGIYAA